MVANVTDGAGAYPQWYALRTRSNHEQKVSASLQAGQIEVFLPIYRQTSRWSDRSKVIERPLFPGYLFARLTPEQFAYVDGIAGVAELLPQSIRPVSVPEEQIETVRRLLAIDEPLVPCPYEPGHAVRIDRGPLAGLQGVVKLLKGATRVVVTVEILRRSVAVEMNPEDLKR